MGETEASDEWTCGKGIAANSEMPLKLAQVLGATAEVLERHTHALNPDEPAGRQELAAYEALVAEHRRIAEDLVALSKQMAASVDMPVAEHDEAVMSDPAGQMEAVTQLRAAQQELMSLLQDRLRESE